MFQRHTKIVHCNIFVSNERLFSPYAVQLTHFGFIRCPRDGQAIIDGLGKYEIGHRHGTVLRKDLYRRLVNEDIERNRIARYIEGSLYRRDGESSVETGLTCGRSTVGRYRAIGSADIKHILLIGAITQRDGRFLIELEYNAKLISIFDIKTCTCCLPTLCYLVDFTNNGIGQ